MQKLIKTKKTIKPTPEPLTYKDLYLIAQMDGNFKEKLKLTLIKLKEELCN
tara:strand:- start:395 stop:547 length:153 start_codon:yes stop_codon:yes gene_type:complete